MILPGVRVFAPGAVVLHGAPTESAGYVLDGRVMVTVRVPVRIRELTVAFQTARGGRWGRLQLPSRLHRRTAAANSDGSDYDRNSERVELHSRLYGDSRGPDEEGEEELPRGRHEFLFRIELPGDLVETMFTAHKRVAYEVRADLALGGALGGAL
ncbi:hypothetical protein IWQ57_002450, partial [Coemansia nantahalensis]